MTPEAARKKWRNYWEATWKLREAYDANDVDYRERSYPVFPEELRGLTCGAKSKRTGQPCKQVALYTNGRCKFHGGLSTGPQTKQGKLKAAINGKLGGRPKKNPT